MKYKDSILLFQITMSIFFIFPTIRANSNFSSGIISIIKNFFSGKYRHSELKNTDLKEGSFLKVKNKEKFGITKEKTKAYGNKIAHIFNVYFTLTNSNNFIKYDAKIDDFTWKLLKLLSEYSDFYGLILRTCDQFDNFNIETEYKYININFSELEKKHFDLQNEIENIINFYISSEHQILKDLQNQLNDVMELLRELDNNLNELFL